MAEDLVQPTVLDRLLASFRALVRAEFPQLTYAGAFEYAITGNDSTTVDCTPVDTTIPLNALAKVPIRSSVSGEKVTLPLPASAPVGVIGLRCVVVFLNFDPARPVVVAIDPYENPVPSVVLGSVARVGDSAGPFTILTGSPTVTKGP